MKRKGGESLLENIIPIKNANKKGIYIADDIEYNVRQGKKNELIKKYQDNLNEAKEEVIRERLRKNNELKEEENQIKKDVFLTKEKERTDKVKFFWITVIGNLFNFLFKILLLIIDLAKIVKNFIINIGSGIKNAGNIGDGVIIKTLLLILLLIGMFFGFNYLFYKKELKNGDINSLVSTDKAYSSFLFKTETPSFFGNLSRSLLDNLPQEYKINYNIFKNKLNSFVGNDIYEIIGKKRGIITDGINDGIYHIKKQGDSGNTYSTLKPNDITIELNDKLSILKDENIDYNKLPDKIKEDYPIKSIIIPVILKNDMWYYNIDKEKYFDGTTDIKSTNPLYNNLFKGTEMANEFKFNKIKALIYNNKNVSKNNIDNMFNYINSKYIYPDIIKTF
jgi:hypothetical protein